MSDMSDPILNVSLTSVPAFLQAIGVLAVYTFIRDALPRLLRKNEKYMTEAQHDRECDLKLTPIKEQVVSLHEDMKMYMKYQGFVPPSERK